MTTNLRVLSHLAYCPVFWGKTSFEGDGPQNFDASRDYLLPIPPLEITNNPNLTQNPGF